MLIKVANNTYINSDRLTAITPHPNKPDAFLLILAGCNIEVSGNVVAFLTVTLDTDDSLVTEPQAPESESPASPTAPPELSLASRVAIHLRDSGSGQTFTALQAVFADADELALMNALQELTANNIARIALAKIENAIETVFIHSSHSDSQW